MTATYSLNEIEALARKAARGCGYDWGLAEEAGRAVRWLAARGLHGPEALLALLRWRDGENTLPLVSSDGICPVTSGAMLCDGQLGGGPAPLCLDKLIAPLLLLPFAHRAARVQGQAVTVTWDETRVCLAPDGAVTKGGQASSPPRADVVLTFAETPQAHPVPSGFRPVADADLFDALAGFAQRTYAPATEHSRKTGAGGSLADDS